MYWVTIAVLLITSIALAFALMGERRAHMALCAAHARISPIHNGQGAIPHGLSLSAEAALYKQHEHERDAVLAVSPALHPANTSEEILASEQTRELRQAYEKLQELDLLKSKFVSDVSHELRTPVTNIVLYLKLIERKPEKQAHYLSVLREESTRLESLVLAVLDLARLDIMPQLTCSPVDVNKVTANVVESFRHDAASRNLELKLVADEALPWVWGDAQRVGQIVNNLVSNALNYTPAGSVTVRIKAHAGAFVCLLVEDTGTGIYADDLPHIFERFYRGKRDQVANHPGTGLGLSIVKELVERHNGTIEMTSEAGKGTTVTVTFPAWHQVPTLQQDSQ